MPTPGDELASVRISLIELGRDIGSVPLFTLTLDGAQVEKGLVISKADIDAGRFVVTPVPHFNRNNLTMPPSTTM